MISSFAEEAAAVMHPLMQNDKLADLQLDDKDIQRHTDRILLTCCHGSTRCPFQPPYQGLVCWVSSLPEGTVCDKSSAASQFGHRVPEEFGKIEIRRI